MLEYVEIRTFEKSDAAGKYLRQREFVDALLGVLAKDTLEGPYVDLYVEGADVPFDTVGVWKYREKKRYTNSEVKKAVLAKFKDLRQI